MAPRWTPEEDSLLKEVYPHSSKADILERIEKSWQIILRRARRLNLHRDKNLIDKDRIKRFKPRSDSCSPEETSLLKEIYENNSKEYVLSKFQPFGRSWQSIKRFAKFLDLKRSPEIIHQELIAASQKGADAMKWPPHEVDILKKIYENGNKNEIMKQIPNRTWKAIREEATKKGLNRNPEIIEKERMNNYKKNMMANYGVEYSTQLNSMKEKSRQTNLKRRGVEYALSSPNVREKIKKSVQEKYGVENVFQSEEIKSKGRETMIRIYGKPCPMQVHEIRERAIKTAKEKGVLPCSNKELDFYKILKQVDPLTEHHVFHPVVHHNIDFYMPKYDVWIQYDGDYWHGRNFIDGEGPQNLNIKKKMKNDEYQNSMIPNLIRFWESDIDRLIKHNSVKVYIKNCLEVKKRYGHIPCYQFRKKVSHKKEDLKTLPFDPKYLKASDFELQYESFCSEIALFIKKYGGLGEIEKTPKWCFTARFRGFLGCTVIMNESENLSINLGEALIQQGSSCSWAPKNLGSRTIMFSCRWMTRNTNKRIFIGYADPRLQEFGTIYQACNFDYLGSNFGSRVLFKHPLIKSGIPFQEDILRSTPFFKKWCKKNNILSSPLWFHKNGDKKLDVIPLKIKKAWYSWNEQIMKEAERIPSEKRHKYVLILGKDKREQKYLNKLKEYKCIPYPIRKYSPYSLIPPIPYERKKSNQSNRRTPEKTEFIVNNYKDMTQKEIAKALKETNRWIDSQIRRLVKEGKLKTKNGIGSTKCRKTPQKISYIRENYGKISRKKIAQNLGESVRWIKRQIHHLKYE